MHQFERFILVASVALSACTVWMLSSLPSVPLEPAPTNLDQRLATLEASLLRITSAVESHHNVENGPERAPANADSQNTTVAARVAELEKRVGDVLSLIKSVAIDGTPVAPGEVPLSVSEVGSIASELTNPSTQALPGTRFFCWTPRAIYDRLGKPTKVERSPMGTTWNYQSNSGHVQVQFGDGVVVGVRYL